MRYALTDGEWTFIRPILPSKSRGGSPNRRQARVERHTLGLALGCPVAGSARALRLPALGLPLAVRWRFHWGLRSIRAEHSIPLKFSRKSSSMSSRPFGFPGFAPFLSNCWIAPFSFGATTEFNLCGVLLHRLEHASGRRLFNPCFDYPFEGRISNIRPQLEEHKAQRLNMRVNEIGWQKSESFGSDCSKGIIPCWNVCTSRIVGLPNKAPSEIKSSAGCAVDARAHLGRRGGFNKCGNPVHLGQRDISAQGLVETGLPLLVSNQSS